MEDLIQQGITYLGGVLAVAITALAVQLFRKLGFALNAEREAQLEYVVRQEVLRQEERAANYLKERGVLLTGQQKLQSALENIVARVPRVDRHEAESIVQAVLPQMGIGAAAAARELGKALKTPKATK